MSDLTVVCVKSKPAYDHVWVNRLARMVRANLSAPYRFVCLTDDPSGLACTTKTLPAGLSGWWAKLAMFRPGLFDGTVLYLDLDSLIVGNLDFVREFRGDFAILRDFYRDDGYGSGVMLWTKPQFHVWQNWIDARRPEHPLGDQGWMEKQVPNARRLQDEFPGKFISYKVHCQGDKLPDGAAVLSFHGTPKNTDFPREHWVSKVWRSEERLAA
jgi:hypothetical protein